MDGQWDERLLYIAIDFCWEYCFSSFSFSVAHAICVLSYNPLNILLTRITPFHLFYQAYFFVLALLLSTIDLRHIHNRRRPQCPM